MNIYTCAFKPFTANDAFFSRDSGLLCKTLIQLGHNSKVIMPRPEDQTYFDPDLVVRGSECDLRSEQWWRELKIDAVAFICWGFKQHTPIIEAANRAGIKTCAIIDSNCNGYPYFDFYNTIQSLWRKGKESKSSVMRTFGVVLRAIAFAVRGLYYNYNANIQACSASIAAFNSKSSLIRAKKRATLFRSRNKINQLLLMGYPIPDNFKPLPTESRKPCVLAIGRWGAVRHKRPNLLMAVAESVVRSNHSITFKIFGYVPEHMVKWHATLLPTIKERIELRGIVPNEEISQEIGGARVLYCPSASEGVPLPVVEALCGGCTVTGLQTDEIPGLSWAFQEGHGTAASDDTIESHVNAILSEMKLWGRGDRNPIEISEYWSKWFSATRYAERLVHILK